MQLSRHKTQFCRDNDKSVAIAVIEVIVVDLEASERAIYPKRESETEWNAHARFISLGGDGDGDDDADDDGGSEWQWL